MIPRTHNGNDPMLCLSVVQKAIRRGDERLAMAYACELVNTSKQHCSMVANRLEIIAHEDVNITHSEHAHVLPFVATSADQARRFWKKPNPAASRMMIGSAIRLLCWTPKSRAGDDFQAAIGLTNLLGDALPAVPDYAIDMHTSEGRRRGRGLEHFRREGAKLVGGLGNEYADEAWSARERARDRNGGLFHDHDGAQKS